MYNKPDYQNASTGRSSSEIELQSKRRMGESPGVYENNGMPMVTINGHGTSDENMTMYSPNSEHANNRFVAGNEFFNYQQFGALRPGGPVTLFSKPFTGLLLAAGSSSFVYAMLRYCLRPTLMNFLGIETSKSSSMMEALIRLPTALSLFIGLISDIFPIKGYRRKSYMIVGSVVAFVMSFGLAALAGAVDYTDRTTDYLVYYMLLIMGTTTGTLISKVATDARVIELSQREPLTTRGLVQINYLIFRTASEAISRWIAVGLLEYDETAGNFMLRIHHFWAFAALAIASLLPIPLVLLYAEEKSVKQLEVDAVEQMLAAGMTTSMPTGPMERVKAFLRMCEQRAVWQILMSLTILKFASSFSFGDASRAVSALADVEPTVSNIFSASGNFCVIATMIAWKLWWTNSSWRMVTVVFLVWLLVCEVVGGLVTVHVLQDQWFYSVIDLLKDFAYGMRSIFSLIPATEVADSGTEGSVVALFLSFTSLIGSTMSTLDSQLMPKIWSYNASSDSEAKLTGMLLVQYGVHALGLFSILLLPRQKLDAQQMRAYGGYSRMASVFLAIIYLLVFVYQVEENLKEMVRFATSDEVEE